MNISNRMTHSAAESSSSQGTSFFFFSSLLAHNRYAETPEAFGGAPGISYARMCPPVGVRGSRPSSVGRAAHAHAHIYRRVVNIS